AVGSERIGCGNGISSSSAPSSVASSVRSSVAPSSVASSTASSRISPSSVASSAASSRVVVSSVTSSSVRSTSGAVLPISTSGNKVLFGGQVGSISGMSMFWSNTGWGGEKYYNAQAVSWLKTDWNAKLVRAAMGVNDAGGYLADAANKTRSMAVIDAAIANDMYVIIDFHTHLAQNYQPQAIAFFQEMATKYGHTNNIIYEIYNEPLQVSWSSVIKPYAVEVIKAIRAIDPDNLIIVGTPTWSQDVDVAAADPIVGYPNIAYTLHFYAGTHGQSLRDKATTALNRGIPLFVTEWGSVNADGNGGVAQSETNAWVAFMKANNISNANWSLTDKAEGSAALVPGANANGGWVSSQLTASGALAKSITLNWPALVNGGSSSSRVASSVASSRVSSSVSSVLNRNHYNATKATTAPVIDGQADAVWNSAEWAPIDVRWLGSQAGTPPAADYTGRYKALWDSGNLYLLFDITDERLFDGRPSPLDNYWEDDTVELFIDENRSGGSHETNTSAWAYHVSTLNDVVDSTTGGAKLLNDHITTRRVSVGDKHMWEMSVRIYGTNYVDNSVNTPLTLTSGKLMGFSAAYIDNDGSSQRESMMGSVDTQGHKDNRGYQDASVFGTMQLVEPVVVGNAAQGKIHWEDPAIGCLFCHQVNSDGTAGTTSKIDPKNLRFTTVANLVNYIEVNMPKGDATACVGQCAADTAAYFLSLKPVVVGSSAMSSSIRSSTPIASSTPALSSVRSSVRSSVQSSVQSSIRSSTASSTVPLDGAALYVSRGCANCHGAKGDSPTRPIVVASWTRDTLIAKIAASMPATNPGSCATDNCATPIADYILTWRPVVSCNSGEDILTRRLRLLTNYEYANTVNDLLNISTGTTIAGSFEADVRVKFFNNDVEAARMTNTRMDAYWNAAESLSKSVSMTNLLSCDAQVPRDQCANTFVPAFGKKAFRRLLTADEQTSYLNLFRLGTTNEAGARLVIQAMLSSPGFLYRTELGSTLTGNTTLTPYETASLLSYTFTASMPDATLFTEADNNRLTTSAQLRTQAERLLGTAKASAQLARFGTQWLKVDDVANLPRDRTLFPAFTPAIGTAMKTEMTTFLSEVFLKPGYKMADLFSPGFSYVNGPLATYYGMSGVSGDQFQRVTTNAQRGGVLHMGAVTATLASMKESHPIHRGLLIRRNLLCQDFAPPPPNIGEVEPLDPNKPTRERFAAHTNNTNCQSCHQYIDNIGFGFENYDAVGRFRTTEGNNLPVNATGNISGLITMSASDNYPFNDLRGLSNVLATSGIEATSKCLTKQYQRFATGISEPNECAVNASYSRWQATSATPDLRTMMLETVTSPTFLTRK
ncbi:MAG: cellulase family glycosylhydrolase, partial [Pseudomonadota bacterium]